MKRRHVIAGVGSIGLASLAGCLSAAGLDKHEASPAGVDPAVREETGYEQTSVDDLRIEEEVGAVGYSEDVLVINYLTEHEKTVDMGPLGEQRGAVFVILSTPKIEIAGRNVNPVEDKSTAELVELVADNYDDIENVERVADDEATILEQTTTMSTFTGDAAFNGQSVDVNLHVTEAVETDDDLLVTIGVYPERAASREESNVRSLAEGVVEGADGVDDGGDDADESDDGESAGPDDGNESNGEESGTDEGDGEDDGNGDGEADDESGNDGGIDV